MINASDARRIALESDAAVEKRLEWLDKIVRELAEQGKYTYSFSSDDTSKTICTSKGEAKPLVTVFQKRLIDKLKSFGYQAAWKPGKEYNGTTWGMLDDHDAREAERTFYETWAVVIQW